MVVPQKSYHRITTWSNIIHLWVYIHNNCKYRLEQIVVHQWLEQLYTSDYSHSQKMETIHMSIDRWMDKPNLCIHALALKWDEFLIHATTWMNLEDIMLSKRSQLQKDKCCAIPLMWSIWHSQSYKQEVQQVGERVAMGKRNQCSVGITFQFCKMKTFKRCVAWLSESSYY